ncbi:MAG TPA: thiamine ABC transporter substrate-binding protein [Chloroflexi bacterium]|nr:thiamine ABC transporter substrate-binding protein [Chloroflexota bacterium]
MKRFLGAMLIVVLLLTGCGAGATTPAPMEEAPAPTEESETVEIRTLRMMTHNSFNISEETIAAFEEAHGAKVEILESGDAGVMVNQAILSVANPLADVLYGVDNTLLSRALNADIFEPYASPLLDQIIDDLKLDPQHRALPVDYGDVCLNYDRAWFEEAGIAPPENLEDLVAPDYKGLTVVQDAASSSPGLAFLLATVGRFGESGDYTYLDYWADLLENDVAIAGDWNEAYWGRFTHGSGGEGDRPIVVSYASSPPAGVYFAEEPMDEASAAPTAAVVGDESCFRQIEFVGVLKGAQNPDLARAWVDFMLDVTFQEDIPLNMFMFPANENADLPEVFARYAVIPENPAEVPYEAIEANREAWVAAWADVALR